MPVTDGTVFVSRYIAEYYVAKGNEVYVLNRNRREQSKGVKFIQADRHDLGEVLRNFHFDVLIDTAYTSNDVERFLNAVCSYEKYILISASAVYPEGTSLPFKGDAPLAINKYWGKYGTDKIEAEEALLKRNPNAYILGPPYLYGQMQLQCFHVCDLCRFIGVFKKNMN